MVTLGAPIKKFSAGPSEAAALAGVSAALATEAEYQARLEKSRDLLRRDGDSPEQPIPSARGMAPNLGRNVVPHVSTFSMLATSPAHSYRLADIAARTDPANAAKMLLDCAILECIEARQRGTAMLNWHIEPEDKDSQSQRDLCDRLTKIVKKIPRFTEYRRSLLEALWYGRSAVQNQYGWEFRKGERWLGVQAWKPINGDKLAFRYDAGDGEYEDGQVGIRVSAGNRIDKTFGEFKLEPTERGMAYFVPAWKRPMLTVHKHMIEDAAYEDGISAGSIHGVGIRSKIYWTWYQKQEALGMLMELMERTGMGFTIWYFPAGNPEAEAKTRLAAQAQTQQNIILVPRTPGDPAQDGYGFDRIEPNAAGVESLKSIVHDFFGHQIKRYILGQILSTEADSTGMGSGVADLHLDSFLKIVSYDAQNLEETLTRELLIPLRDFNFPEASGIDVRFCIDTESDDTDRKLAAFKQAWDMGLKIRAADVFDVLGATRPTEDDEVLENSQLTHLGALAEMQGRNAMGGGTSGGMPMPGQPVDAQPAPNAPSAPPAETPPMTAAA